MSESTYHQIHFAWAEPTLLGRVGPGPAASSLAESDQPALRSWRDRLIPALTVDYRSALPGTDPAALPETLWSRTYPDGQAALVYRWPGAVRYAHAWAVVGPAHGLTLPRVLSLHENPNTRPDARRPPAPGWANMPTLATPTPWELTAAPGAVRTRDRRAAETTVQGEAVLVGALASALHSPERPIRIALAPEDADLWQATQIRLLWGVHRALHDILTPPRAIPAAGWQWSFSTYDPDLSAEGQHLAFGPPGQETDGPFKDPPPPDHRRAAEHLAEVLRDEGGDALAEHLRERGVPDAPTFGDRRALLLEWLDPRAATVASGPGTRADTSPAAGPDGSDGDEARDGGPGRAEGHVHADEHHRPHPYPLSRSVVGAHPSFRVNHPPEDDDGEPLPEAEDLDAPSSAHEAPQHPPRPSHVLFGEHRPGSTARAEHPIFGAPEPHDPPSNTTDEPQETQHTPEPPENHTFAPGGLAPALSDPEEHAPARTGTRRRAEEAFGGTARITEGEPHAGGTDPEDAGENRDEAPTPHGRSPEQAPPLNITHDAAPASDYATETEPETDPTFDDSGANWPIQYADLPLARLERWHSKRGPQGAHTDVVDARAAVRAERSELQRVRDERDHYHAEVQDLRREVARLDRPFLEGHTDRKTGIGGRRWPARVLVLVLLLVFLTTGLEAGARFGVSSLDMFTALLP